jgi:hypothetical protein
VHLGPDGDPQGVAALLSGPVQRVICPPNPVCCSVVIVDFCDTKRCGYTSIHGAESNQFSSLERRRLIDVEKHNDKLLAVSVAGDVVRPHEYDEY